jgi:methyltransferase family protein
MVIWVGAYGIGSGCAFGAMKSRSLSRLSAAMTVFSLWASATWAQTPDVPFVPTPPVVVDAMLKLAGVGPEDYVIDLGSGDGRIVIAAARKHGARGFGVEIDPALVGEAQREARRQGVDGRVEFKMDDLLQINISRATVVTMYLYPRLMLAMRPRLITELKPGARIVSHEFTMEGWEPDARMTVPVPDKPYGPPSSEVLLWIVPADARGVWQWRLAAGTATIDYEIALSQDFQKLASLPGGRSGRIEAGTMKGAEIRFFLVADEGGRALRHEYRGRVGGDSIRGIVRLVPIRANPASVRGAEVSTGPSSAPGTGLADGVELPWNATRVRKQ